MNNNSDNSTDNTYDDNSTDNSTDNTTDKVSILFIACKAGQTHALTKFLQIPTTTKNCETLVGELQDFYNTEYRYEIYLSKPYKSVIKNCY